jgi:zinc protease
MRFPTRLLLLSFVFLTAFAHAAPPAPVWPHEQSDLKPDQRITFGRLENGFRYMVMPHAKPAGRVTLHLLVEAGSFHENDNERGLAHFVEHMVFNGSRDFPGDETIKTLQRLGLRFGADLNATTTALQTDYFLRDLSVADPGALPTGLKFLRNVADGALFDKAAVTKERAVILAELRSRKGDTRLTWDRELEFLPPHNREYTSEELDAVFDGTRFATHLDPAGSEKVIAKASPARLRAFYDRVYRPENMILAVVGDIDPAAVSLQIEQAFTSLKSRTPPAAPLSVGNIKTYSETSLPLKSIGQKWNSQVHLSLTAALGRDTADSTARRTADLPALVALQLLYFRFEQSVRFPATFEAFLSHPIVGIQLPLLRAHTPRAHLQQAATALVTEVRRAQQHGFSKAEVAQGIQFLRDDLDATVREAGNRTASDLARALAVAAARNVVLTDPSENRALALAALAAITPETCQEAMRRLWPSQRTVFALWGDLEEKDFTESLMTSVGNAWNAEHAPAAETTAQIFPYTDFGPPGEVASQRHDEALDCSFLQFANGVRFTFKRTPFEPGRAAVRINFGDGGLGGDSSAFRLAIGPLFFGGLTGVPFEHMGKIVKNSGASMDISFGFSDASYYIAESLDLHSLPLGLNFLTACLTAPAFCESADSMTRATFEPTFAPSELKAAGVAEKKLRSVLYNGHRAAVLPSIAESRAASFAALRDYISPQLLQSPLHVTLVGDISLEDAIAHVARTFGALPPRTVGEKPASRFSYTPPKLPHRETVVSPATTPSPPSLSAGRPSTSPATSTTTSPASWPTSSKTACA